MLIPFTIDSHLAALQGVECVASVSIVVLCGVGGAEMMHQVVVNE
jgi:hypothetical protein